ncbi:PAS domain-containing protein [Candidatus Endomicrobiellum devescovinae]|jgi:PAS domain S-box-containing protein|uniref:PAS domain-containing protein n=1 Tax=Candidatus Endomicrobiellum devescovinae TaxID=3242322 RepID=UPI002824FB30|nr:PAS domain-containing sensor histidine kinase [Endomicrobium sp.]
MVKKSQIEIDDILQIVPGCIYWKDVNGVYLGCNQAEAEILGFKSSKEVIGKTDYDLVWKNNADVLRETDKRVMQTRVPEEIIEAVTVANGKILLMLTKKSLLYDDKSNVIGIIGVSIDITDRKAKESKETELKRQWYINNILQYVPGCIYWKDINGVYLGCNQAEIESLGLNSFEDIIGKTDYDLAWKEIANVLKKTDERIMQTRIPEEIIEEPTLADGKVLIMLTKKSPLYDDKGNVIGIIGVSVDITDRKEKEELEIRLKLQEELYRIARDVAHDIVSPLTALGAFQYLVSKKLTEKENEILDSLKRSIKDIAGKMMEKYKEIKDIGDTKAISTAKKREEKEEEKIDLNLSMKEVIERKKYEYSKKNVEIKYEGKEKLVFIKGESRDFERMMSNIINNGVESVEGKKADIEISYEVKREEVEIRVKDNGKGMPKEMAEKLMKGEEIGTTKKEGHGIGTQQIISTIKAMNGLLKIESKENVGTEFIVSFKKVQESNN